MAKKYYWIKLKTDFFDLETIDWLISQKNGCEYVVLYQKLCLLTANKGGELVSSIGEIIMPYDANKIARDTKFSFDTVVVALELFRKIGLIYEQENGILKIPYVSDIVGSETESAQRVRNHRANKANEALQCNKNVTQDVTNVTLQCNTEIEKDIELDLDKEKEKKNNNKSDKSQIENDFEDCWNIYPKKQGKSAAKKAYIKFARKDPELKEKVISGINNYLEYIRKNKIENQFIKQGSTYFNGEYWYDDYDVKKNEYEDDFSEFFNNFD